MTKNLPGDKKSDSIAWASMISRHGKLFFSSDISSETSVVIGNAYVRNPGKSKKRGRVRFRLMTVLHINIYVISFVNFLKNSELGLKL